MSSGSIDDKIHLWAQARVRGVVMRGALAAAGEVPALTDEMNGDAPVPRPRTTNKTKPWQQQELPLDPAPSVRRRRG